MFAMLGHIIDMIIWIIILSVIGTMIKNKIMNPSGKGENTGSKHVAFIRELPGYHEAACFTNGMVAFAINVPAQELLIYHPYQKEKLDRIPFRMITDVQKDIRYKRYSESHHNSGANAMRIGNLLGGTNGMIAAANIFGGTTKTESREAVTWASLRIYTADLQRPLREIVYLDFKSNTIPINIDQMEEWYAALLSIPHYTHNEPVKQAVVLEQAPMLDNDIPKH